MRGMSWHLFFLYFPFFFGWGGTEGVVLSLAFVSHKIIKKSTGVNLPWRNWKLELHKRIHVLPIHLHGPALVVFIEWLLMVMFLIIITTSRPHILLASYDTSPHTHSTTSPHKNLNYLYINIRKIITFHDNTTTTKSIKTGWVHEYIGLHFFISSILKWYTLQWGWTGTHFPNRKPPKTCIQNALKVDALGTPLTTSLSLDPSSWPVDFELFLKVWFVARLLAPSFHHKISSEHMRRRWMQAQAGALGGEAPSVCWQGLGWVLHTWGPLIHVSNYLGYKNVNNFSPCTKKRINNK